MKLGNYTFNYPDILINEESGEMYNVKSCIDCDDIDKELVEDLLGALKEAHYILSELED